MSEDIFEQYKRLADDRLSDSNPEMWDRIEETLELDKGWDRIDASLRSRKRRPVILMCLIAGLLMLISVFGYFKFDSTPNPSSSILSADSATFNTSESFAGSEKGKNMDSDKISALHTQHEGTERTTTDSRMGEQKTNDGNFNQADLTRNPSHRALSSSYSVDSSNSLNSTEELRSILPAESSGIISARESFINLPIINANGLSHSNSAHKLSANEIPQTEKHKLYMLAALGVRGTLFLNNHTSKAVRNESFEYVNIKPSSSFQFGFGAELHGRWIMETRVHLNNQGGQSVHYLSEGKSVFADTRLKYTSFEISAGSYFNHSESPRMRWMCASWQAGAYISFLQDVNVYTNSSQELDNSGFKSTDYGLVLRYSLHKRIGSFDITAGAMTSFGLRNISETKPGVPDYFNKCYNTAAGVNIGCKYFF